MYKYAVNPTADQVTAGYKDIKDLGIANGGEKKFYVRIIEHTDPMPEGVTQTGGTDGYNITVTVKYDYDEGELTVTKSTGDQIFDFTNTYNTKDEKGFEAKKTLEGRKLKGDEFTFELYETKDDTFTIEEGQKPVETKTNDEFGKVKFATMYKYAVNPTADQVTAGYKDIKDLGIENGGEAKIYVRIIENTELMPGGVTLTGGTDGYNITVTVKYDYDTGKLTVTKSTGDQIFEFINTYKAEGEVQLFAKKDLVRRNLKDGEFTFSLYRVNGTVEEPVQEHVPNVGNDVTFDKILYKQGFEGFTNEMDDAEYQYDDEGNPISRTKEITYVIREDIPTDGKEIDNTVIYDAEPQYVKVTLTDDLKGKISAVTDPTDTKTITFTNIVTKIQKIGADGKTLLSDAYLEVWAPDGTEPVDAWLTDGNPHEVKDLEVGTTYTLKETVVPRYTELNEDGETVETTRFYKFAGETTFTVNKDGDMTIEGKELKLGNEEGLLLLNNELASQPESEKKIKDINDTTDDEYTGWQDAADHDIGDAIPYQLTATLADNVTDYREYHITFKDTMEKGLTFNGIDAVTVNGEPAEYQLNSTDHSFDLTLKWGDGENKITDKTLNKAEVEVLFTAILNDDANLGSMGNVNTSYLEYSCNPNVDENGKQKEDTDETEEDSVIAFTYKVDINKVDKDGKALKGAQFKLEKKIKDGEGFKWEEIDRLNIENESSFSFKGLDDGDYKLTETRIPKGMKTIDPIEFTVTADHGIVWEGEERTTILTGLTGDVTKGVLKLEADEEAWTGLTGNVKNEEAEKPKSEKKIKDINDTTDTEYTGWQDSADHDIGDAIPYQLTATLADNVTDYREYHITFKDTMEKGLTFNGIDAVTVNGEPAEYQLNSTDHSFDLTLKWGDGENKITDKTLNKAEVEVLFTAILNDDANLGSMGNVNTSYLEYSCNANVDENGKQSDETEDTEEDTVIAFTYKVEVNKVDELGKALKGADFRLEKILADGTAKTVKTVKNEVGDVFTFNGLDDGTYVLTETTVPDGFKGIKPVTFKVEASHVTEWNGAEPARDKVLESLTGEVITGELKFEVDRDLGSLVADVANENYNASAAVKKVWNDDNNRDNLRPASLTLLLLADGESTGKAVTLNAQNGWTAIITGLRKHNDAKAEIKYSWSEPTVLGYTLTNTANTGVLTTLTNTHQPEETEVKVRKVWADGDDAAKKRPASIEVQLYADGQATGKKLTLDASNDWSGSWKELRKCVTVAGAKSDIKYTVAETTIPEGYIATITGNASTGYVITNTYEAGKLVIEKTFDIEPWEPETPDDSPVDIPVIKTWNDNNNKDGNRPASVTVRLYADGTEVANAVLNAENGWRTVFTGLPRLTEAKEKIKYTISEDPVEWYEAVINGYNIRNDYKPEVTSVSVRKEWNDGANFRGLRPASIVMMLSNGMTVVLDAQNNWSATLDNLPTKVNGVPVEYPWTEQNVIGYVQENVSTEGNVTTFTNGIIERPETPTTGGKKPKTTGETWYVFEEYDTPLGVEVVINHVGDCFD